MGRDNMFQKPQSGSKAAAKPASGGSASLWSIPAPSSTGPQTKAQILDEEVTKAFNDYACAGLLNEQSLIKYIRVVHFEWGDKQRYKEAADNLLGTYGDGSTMKLPGFLRLYRDAWKDNPEA